MAVEYHEGKDRNGDIEGRKDLTPVKAIRLNCLECLGWSPDEVKNCTAKNCWLWPYRLGKNPKRNALARQKSDKNRTNED